jgi:hypothetical protein
LAFEEYFFSVMDNKSVIYAYIYIEITDNSKYRHEVHTYK